MLETVSKNLKKNTLKDIKQWAESMIDAIQSLQSSDSCHVSRQRASTYQGETCNVTGDKDECLSPAND